MSWFRYVSISKNSRSVLKNRDVHAALVAGIMIILHVCLQWQHARLKPICFYGFPFVPSMLAKLIIRVIWPIIIILVRILSSTLIPAPGNLTILGISALGSKKRVFSFLSTSVASNPAKMQWRCETNSKSILWSIDYGNVHRWLLILVDYWRTYLFGVQTKFCRI